jgi:uncharacterized membrane protein
MERLSGLIFWIPVALFLIISAFFIKWNRHKVILATLLITLLFFFQQVLNHRHFESPTLLVIRIGCLFVSFLALILYLLYDHKNR